MEESVCYKLPLASTFLRDECVVRRVMCGMPAFQLRHGNGDELRFVEQWRVHPTQITSATKQMLCATLSGTFFFFFLTVDTAFVKSTLRVVLFLRVCARQIFLPKMCLHGFLKEHIMQLSTVLPEPFIFFFTHAHKLFDPCEWPRMHQRAGST